MSESITVALPRTKCENVRVLLSRIRLLYGVSVDVDTAQGIAVTPDSAEVTSKEISHLTLTATDGNQQQQLNQAKDYLLAACSDSGSRCERRYQYASDVIQQLMPMRDEVERESSAMVKFEPQESLVVVSGLERNVLAAIRYLDAKAQDIVASKSKGLLQDSAGAAAREVFRQCRGHLESEDSSYDSDYENVDPSTPSQENVLPPQQQHQLPHDDVSRTVSDTLGAEFAEYVTTDAPQPPSLRDLGSILSDPNYTSRVEFALKLGYTETQVQIALQKLGAQPSQNELLAELIKLGATCAPPSSVGETRAPSKDVVSEEVDRGQDAGGGALDAQRTDSFDGSSNLRHIVIDGSNVAMSHGNKECFSCRGIKLSVDWFKARGHQNITVFVPRWRKEVSRPDAPIKDQEILTQLEKERLLVFTPSRHVGGRRMVCYDDRYVLRLAADTDGIVVSNDNYKDLAGECPEFKKVIEERLLMYSFVNDRFMPPEDPLGRHGPSLDNFLRKTPARSMDPLPPPCPYGKKCTYGNKCKYYHPERGNQPQKSVTERLAEQAKIPLQEVKSRGLKSRETSPGDKFKPSMMPASGTSKAKKQPLVRTKSLIPSLGRMDCSMEKGGGNLVERTKSDSSAGRSLDDSSLLSHHHEQAMFHSPASFSPTGPASWAAVPQLTSASVMPQPPPSTTAAVSSWAALSPTLPPNIPGSCAEMFLEPDSGGHLFVAKRLSDPDSHPNKPGAKGFPASSQPIHPPQGVVSQDTASGNLHRKLQRQLSLNPAYDPRLMHMGNYSGHHQMLSPQQEGYSFMQQQDAAGLDQGVQEGLQSIHRAFGRNQPVHEPLNRMASEGRAPNPLQAVPHVWEGVEHQTVTRIASAPDANLQWPPPLSRMQHLNSTSDTRLNLYPDMQRGPPSLGMRYSEGQQHQWMSQSHGLENPRPMSPIGPPVMAQSSGTWQEHLPTSGRSTSQVIGQPVRPSSVPPHGMQLCGLSLPARSQTPETPLDARYKLEYHLSSIFPKEQVRAAMEMYPQETNPQKICAAILSMFPPPKG